MDSAYDRKFEEMKSYIPFLERMINKLLSTSDSVSTNPRQGQLDKIRSLRDLLLNKNKRMKMENLLKCEQVLINLYTKLEQTEPSTTLKPVTQFTVSKDKTELETVRNKLKTVAKIQDGMETLPDIARANDIELKYPDSKQPALFQRRPNKNSNSPVRTVKTSCEINIDSLESQNKRNYTRVLVSPDREQWPTSEQSSSDKPLFSRRSPPKITTSQEKKDKKKKKSSKLRKTNEIDEFELKLNVPQDSLNSEDVISRLIKSDADIDTLGVCRTKIIAELKRMGKNEDISDLILKSYDKAVPNKINKPKNKTSKEDIEEGELSDSESEAIESIYGGLPPTNKSSNKVETKEQKEQTKINICLPTSDKDESNSASKTKEQSYVIDLVNELEMCTEKENVESIDKISIDSDTLSSPIQEDSIDKTICDNSITKRKIDTKPPTKNENYKKSSEYITSENSNDNFNNDSKNVNKKNNERISDNLTDKQEKIKQISNSASNESGANSLELNLNNNLQLNKSILEDNRLKNSDHEHSVQKPKFVANFYKPIEEQHNELSNITNTEISDTQFKNKVTISMQPASTNFSEVISHIPEKQNDDGNKTAIKNSLGNNTLSKASYIEKTFDDSQNIPLLNEPSVPPQAKASVLSEIDILQALKNEILSDSISVPGTETGTPALHQPKLIKVANAQEVLPKKKISIEKYKEKVSKPTTNPLFFKSRRRTNDVKEDVNKKQSLKLTDKECERFNFPKRLSLEDDDCDDDDIDDISDTDFLIEDKDDSLGLNDIYGDLAPKSPENDTLNKNTTPPIIIPTDSKSFEANVVRNKGDVDMRALLPISLPPQPIPPPILSPLMPSVTYGTVPPSPSYGVSRNVSDVHKDLNDVVPDGNRIRNLDPRKRHDLRISSINSPNPYAASNQETSSSSRSFNNVVSSAPNANQVLPNRAPNMTPNYTPSIPQLRTPNARTFEMSHSHQTFDLEDTSNRKHVYAPSFSISENREKESVSNDVPYWDVNKSDIRNRKNRWTESNKRANDPVWEDRGARSNSAQNDGSYTPRYEDTFTSKYDNYNNRARNDKYNVHDRRESYSNDCPPTPVPSFGWLECPPTSSSVFGRQEAPMTPSHSFGRSDCPTTPMPSFGRGECPSTPSSGFGRGLEIASNHSYNRLDCPPTPNHSFGRSECPQTPSHPFGRSECPRTPSHPFGRSENVSYNRPDISNNYNHKYSKDPRLNRKTIEFESNPYNDRDYGYNRERNRNSSSYKSQSKPYSPVDPPRNYEREKSVGRNDREYVDRNMQLNDTTRRDRNTGVSTSTKGADNNRFNPRNREGWFDSIFTEDYDVGFRHNHREKSLGLSSENKKNDERARLRALSVGRNIDKELNKDNISFESESGRNFTINTSVKSTFQDFKHFSKSKQVFENTFDARRQRAASVGRSLEHKECVDVKLTTGPVGNYSMYAQERHNKFKRASSVGREILKPERTFQELKADLRAFKPLLNKEKKGSPKNWKTVDKVTTLQEKFEAFKSTLDKKESTKHNNHRSLVTKKCQETHQNRKNLQSRSNISPRKNFRDQRIRKDKTGDIKTRYKIDRRPDTRNKSSGIIYSNDNIAKGTIMSGFGVKNYKIPKIKRTEPEVSQANADEIEIQTDEEKNEVRRSSEENDKKIKPKEPSEPVCEEREAKNKKVGKSLNDIVNNDSEVRVTRSKKTDVSNVIPDDVDDIVVKPRKSKRSVIYDSDSDSEPEKDMPKGITQKSNSEIVTSSKKSNTVEKVSPIDAKSQINENEEILDSNFVIDDMEPFPENLESTSEKYNINALIADLDNDFMASKTENHSQATGLEKISNPKENNLHETSEKEENDFDKFNKEVQKDSTTDNSPEMIKFKEATIQKQDKPLPNTDCNVPDESQLAIIGNNETSTLEESNLPKDILNNTDTSKDNEAIDSTTEIDQGTKDITSVNVISNIVDLSVPDSTINKHDLNNISDGLPDSTNEINCELSSEVTSTNDNSDQNKESDLQNTNVNEKLDSIESLLSILQDKSKIKELLARLGDKSSDNEKIKKKLEKLSEIVSDDEEEKQIVSTEENISDTTIPIEKTTIETDLIKTTNTNQISLNSSDKKISTIVEIEKYVNDPTTDSNTLSKQCNSLSNTDKADAKITSDTELGQNINSENENNKVSELRNESETGERVVESLIKTVTKLNKKLQPKNSKGKFKAITKKIPIKKRITRATPAKTGIKKRGELQKLQEDLKEFMCDTMNATGIRMCRLAKMVNDKETVETHPVVMLEKVKEAKEIQNKKNRSVKLRKKPGPKPKTKTKENKIEINKTPETVDNISNLKSTPKYKPGPKSKTKPKTDETDPYEFDTDSIADTNTTKESEDDSSASENESLMSSRSCSSSEVLADAIKKTRRRRRGTGGWKSGIIKSKSKKKKEQKNLIPKTIALLKPTTVPDINCFTDKLYCFEKGRTSYDCRLCIYSGTDIVKHFKKQHPHTEIPLSRLNQKTAKLAIQQCEQKNFQILSKMSSDKYVCRFCHKEFGNGRNILETFFWHVVSNHTGEFKSTCSECVNPSQCPFNVDIPPPPKGGGQLIGHICQKCNFTQISVENLKTHVIVHHNDEETEVFTINLAVMSNKVINTMLRRAQSEKSRVLRSLRSKPTTADHDDIRDDSSEVSESNDHEELNTSEQSSETCKKTQDEDSEQKPKLDQIKHKLAFENDDPVDSSVKTEQEEGDENSHLEHATFEVPLTSNVLERGNSDIIVDYPHFKINYTESGGKEYVCCINRNDNHYKTSLMISMKKHIQTKHTEKWDGYCSLCKVIVTLQGVQSDFRDCLSHLLDKHIDDFPVLEKEVESTRKEIETPIVPEPIMPAITVDQHNFTSDAMSVLPTAVLSAAIPSRVATPPVERTSSPSYIAVRPLAELISRDLVNEIGSDQETPIALPKIKNVVSLGETTVPPAQSNPSYPNNEPAAATKPLPFLYEEVQAEVMSKKHRVVLDAMMTRENVVRVFKCAGRYCSFTTDCLEDALLHASAHRRVGGEGALQCSYCNYDSGDNGIDLVMHVFKEHSRCQFCCPLCFYRAASSQLVGAHYVRVHTGAAPLKSVLRSTAAPPATGPSPVLLSREVAVQHYVCSHDNGTCNFKIYTPGKFCEHLKQRHGIETTHPCNMCPHRASTPAKLVVHLQSHGLQRYQCTRCVRGAGCEDEMLAHAAAAHPDCPPQAYVRLITNKEGEKRVLPLASLNRSKIPFEDITPNPIKENPVKEAERSIELEKLIAHTMMISEVIISQCSDAVAPEEAEDFATNDFHDDLDETEEGTALAAPETPDHGSTAAAEPAAGTPPPAVKTELEAEAPVVSINNEDIICLDSDEEPDSAAELPAPAPADAVLTNLDSETLVETASVELPKSSVTDEVSITKVTEITPKIEVQSKPSLHSAGGNIIDLSDDAPAAAAATVDTISEEKVQKINMYKCPCCPEAFKSPYKLKKHLSEKCLISNATTCPYQNCQFVVTNVGKLVSHYAYVHALQMTKTATCGVCHGTFTNVTGAKIHIRSAHKVTNYTVETRLDESGVETQVISEATTEPVRISGRKTSAEVQRYRPEPPAPRPRKTSTENKKRYGVRDIDKLPISPILDSHVYCELCEFGTKVRLNMVRHLQQHADNAAVPHTAPVNPVPHLETNEMHFDKMLNLASSSLAARAGPSARLAPAAAARYPRLVPERQRYTCGARACSYTSLDAAMLRCHWETLHARETEYRCRHCPAEQAPASGVPLTAARVLAHLRMHADTLYACSRPDCPFYHYRRHLVEKHIAESHADAGVLVVREDSAEPAPPPAAPTMDLTPWRCGLCDYSSMLRPNVVAHCALQHQSKMQFKCSHCSFRSSAKENVVKHQGNAHPGLPEDIFYYFYREGSLPLEGGLPRWKLQRERLGLDEKEVKPDPEPEPPAPPPGPPPAPAVDLNLVKEEKPEDSELALDDLCDMFGQFCDPDGLKYKCCLCTVVRESSREAMQSHLFEELNYRRWECVICSYKAFHKAGLSEHMRAEHSRQCSEPRALPDDARVERWVAAALDHQAAAIQHNLARLSQQKMHAERTPPTTPQKQPDSPKPNTASDAELLNAFGDFGAPKNQHYACPKCDFTTKDEHAMVTHLESELSKIRWGCSNCTDKYQTFHEAQFHCKSHVGQAAQPRESIRDPSLRSGWVKAVVSSQRQFIKCISETNREPSAERSSDSEPAENSLLVALYERPVALEERRPDNTQPKRAAAADSDDERLVIDEPPAKKVNARTCPYCDYNIQNTRYIREHILKEHYNIKPYKCFYCSFAGSRQGVTNHTNNKHPGVPKRIVIVEVPSTLPPENTNKNTETGAKSTRGSVETVVPIAPVAKPTKRDAREDEVAKKVCLYCEKSVSENETGSHTHGTEKAEFAKRGDVVVKCCKCLVLRLSITSMQEHFEASHPGENVLDNYAYFKLQVDTREIHCCGHCYKKFKFLRDLKVHNATSHTSLSLSYTSIPFSHNLHTEGEPEIGKRKADDAAGPWTKRVAKKSTSKPTNSPFAKKSTTKLPYSLELEESSSYGSRPLPLDHYKNVTLSMPVSNSVVELDVQKLSGMLRIDPKVVLEDYNTST